jgi:hypothetical protein
MVKITMKEITHEQILNKIDNIYSALVRKIDILDKKICLLDKKTSLLDKKTGSMDRNIESLDKRLSFVETKLFEHDRRFEMLEERTVLIPRLYDNVDKLIKLMMDDRQERVFMNHRLDKLEKKCA